jgi:hypothetical protein
MNIVTFAGANLPAVSSLSTSLRKLEADVGPAGVVILKMDRTGHWVFGADQTEVEDGSHWAINPFSFVHGYIAWGDGEVLGEKMASVSEPLPELDVAPPGAKKGWETQVGMSLKCITGKMPAWKRGSPPRPSVASARCRNWPWQLQRRWIKTKPPRCRLSRWVLSITNTRAMAESTRQRSQCCSGSA